MCFLKITSKPSEHDGPGCRAPAGGCVFSVSSHDGWLLSRVPPLLSANTSPSFQAAALSNRGLREPFRGFKRTNKVTNPRTRGRASLGASPAPEDRRECLLCVHKTLGLWVSGHVTHHAFCTVTWHAAIPFRDGISSSDLPPKGLLFQGGEARVLRFRVYTAHFPITVTFDRSSVSRRP